MNSPRVSVITAAYNAERWLEECLASLSQQTFGDWEAVICDDGSTDGTWNVMEAFARKEPRLRLLKNERNLGNGPSSNRCLEVAGGEFVAIQDADDVSSPDRLAAQVDFLDQHPEFAFISSGMFLFDDRGTYAQRHPNKAIPTRWDFLFSTAFFHAPTMFRTQCLKALGGYRVAKETKRGLDYDLLMRLYATGFRGKNLNACLYGYRVGAETYGRRKFHYRIDEMIVRYKGFRALKLFPWALPFVIKPLVAGVLPLSSIARIRRRWGR